MKTRAQIFAEEAFNVVREWNQAPGASDLRSYAKGFPALVQTCGLLQAFAYAQAETSMPKKLYIKGFARVLDAFVNLPDEEGDVVDRMAARLQSCGSGDYMLYSRVALEAASWIKRYAAIVLPEPQS